MEFTRFGRSGLEVSRLCLGCMSYGVPERGTHPWSLGEAESRPFLRRALDLGFNFFDTANVYSDGTSEEIVGRALKDFARRDEIVLATKVHGRMHKGPNGAGLSRKAILSEIDHSLRRLGTDYVDLYQMAPRRFVWNPTVIMRPVVEPIVHVLQAAFESVPMRPGQLSGAWS